MKPVLKKIAVALGTLVFVLVFNFFLFRIAGDPKNDLIRGNPRLSEAGRERLIHERGLDKGYLTQFRIYVDDTLHGDFGTSFQTNQPVSTMIWAALPNTLILVGISTLLATFIGSWLGIYAAANRGSPGDTGVVQTSLFFYAMPDFWAGMVLIWFFAVEVGLFPTGQKSEPGASFSTLGYTWNVIQHAMLPIITLTIGIIGQYVVIMRSSLADVLGEDFVTTARAIGLPQASRAPPGHPERDPARRRALGDQPRLRGLGRDGRRDALLVAGDGPADVQRDPEQGLSRACRGSSWSRRPAVIIANLIADLAYTYLDPRVRTS